MKLPINPISQRDPRWAKKKLGNKTGTIGSYGCLLACHTLLLNYYGKEFTVDSLNEFYKSNKVFDGNLINYFAAADCWQDITADEFYNCYDDPCDLTRIDNCLEERKPVIALVDFSPKAGVQTHFIIIIGKNEAGSYICIDPWDGIEIFFEARFGDPVKHIYGLRLYSGPVPKEETESTDALKARNKKLMEQLIEEGQLITALRADIFKMEQDAAEDQVELVELRERNRKLELDAGRLKKSEDRVMELEEQQKALKVRLVALEKTKIEKMTTKQIVDLLIGRIFRRG